MLLLERNLVVSRHRLTEALWPEGEPPSAAESLDAYVYRLRKQLGHDRLIRRDGGYLLRVEAGELDTDDFQRLLVTSNDAGEAGDRRGAVTALSAALTCGAVRRGPTCSTYRPPVWRRAASTISVLRHSKRERRSSSPSGEGQTSCPSSSVSSQSIRCASVSSSA